MSPNIETRQCNKCNVEKPLTPDYFFRHPASKQGLATICKECEKERRMKRGKNIIYKITHLPSNYFYIGQTVKPLSERVSKHFSDAKLGREGGLYDSMRKDDRESFKWEILEVVEDRGELDNRERYYIQLHREQGCNLFNEDSGGSLGKTVSNRTRLKQSRSKGGKPFFAIKIDTKEVVGEFHTYTQANRELYGAKPSLVLNGKQPSSKGYTFVYSDSLSQEAINAAIARANASRNARKQRISGANNPMHRTNGLAHPCSKKVVIVRDGQVEIYNSSYDAEAQYNFQVRHYARGGCNHFYKKLNLLVYYEDIFHSLNKNKDEVSYES